MQTRTFSITRPDQDNEGRQRLVGAILQSTINSSIRWNVMRGGLQLVDSKVYITFCSFGAQRISLDLTMCDVGHVYYVQKLLRLLFSSNRISGWSRF